MKAHPVLTFTYLVKRKAKAFKEGEMKTSSRLIFIVMFMLSSIVLKGQWERTFGPFGWTVYHFAVGNSTLFSDGGIIFRSTDNGMSWQNKSEGIWYWDVTALFVSDYGVFAGVAENGNGLLFYSDDNGENWSQITLSTNEVITGFAQINSDLYIAAERDGVFKSVDGGITWNKISNSLNDITLTSLLSVNETLILGTLGNGLLKSTDNGETWESCGSTGYFNWISHISFSNNVLYVTCADWNGGSGAFRSNDMGASFSDITPSLYVWTIYSSDNKVYIGTDNGIYRSTNQGITWELIGLSDAGVNSIITLNGSIIVGTRDVGIHTSNDNGATWINTGYSEWSAVKSVLAINDNLVIGCDGAVGVSVSRDNGNTFTEYHNLNQSHVNIFVNNYDEIFVGTTPNLPYRGGVYHSSDLGATWNNIGIIGKDILSLAVKDNYLFAGSTYDGVYRTTNNGNSWNQLNNGLNSLWISALAFVGDNLYAGTNSGVYLTTDFGLNWNFIGMEYEWIKSFCVKDGVLYATVEDGIYMLTPQNNWNKIEIPDHSYFQFIYSFDDYLFVGASNQLLLSADNGTTWKSIFQSSNDIFINSIFANNDFVYCGTWGDGLWKVPLDVITEVKDEEPEIRFDFNLAQNYPNPFNPITSIGYTIPRSEYVILKIYDILGNEVAELVNEQKPAGRYRVNFDGENLSSGLYLYKIQAGSFNKVNKMILLK
jgi:photosystem II stability/assembly factor-like uncharacterized protein